MQKPPQAKKIPKILKKHGDIRIDDYYWLNDKKNKDVLAYLKAENQFYESYMSDSKELESQLYQELKNRIREDDSSVPYLYNQYYYITRFEKGKEYPIYSRKYKSLDAPEEILFDCNEMAVGHDYYKLGGIEISPDNRTAAFFVDLVGNRICSLHFKDLTTNKILPIVIENVTGVCAWANDNQTLFYSKQNEVTLRSDTILRINIESSHPKEDLVYFEEDDTFDVFVYREKSNKYLVIGSTSTLTSEYQILLADTPYSDFNIFQTRMPGVEYSISHYENSFYIITNKDEATNFKIMRTPENKTSVQNWEEYILHNEDVLIEDLDVFKEYLVVSEREKGLSQIKIIPQNGESYYIKFNNETYTTYTTSNAEFDTPILRYGYQSLTTPPSIIDFDMRTKEQEVKKEQEILDVNFNKDNYVSERVWAQSHDGVQVPMSVVYKKGIQLDGNNPLLQYGYGSYGYTIDPTFSASRLSLLDRGFIFVIAHVRGSEYLGRSWYEEGKLLKKKNTFLDFIACSKYLIKNKYTNPNRLYIQGGSAGGLLVGVVLNSAPELYHGAIADVPFVDIVTTMLDDTIPLTTGEYDEWGNPNQLEYYEYMKSYSPYDNVKNQEYPHLLVTTGLYDTQVQYWEPAKWVALLRERKLGDSLLFLETNMKAGHGGSSGRLETLKEIAKEFSFLLKLESKNQ